MSKGSLGSRSKDPDEILDYAVDWTDLLASGETISSVTWTVPTGLTKTLQTESSAVATVWLSGGTTGQRYLVECKIVTSQSRTFDRSFELRCEQK